MRAYFLPLCLLTLAIGCSHSHVKRTATAVRGRVPEAETNILPINHEVASPQVGMHFDGSHSVEHYIKLGLERNPEIIARHRIVAARANVVPQVTSLPDPMLTNTAFPIADASIQTAAGRIANSLTLSQRFPWHGKLHLRGQIADHETSIAMTQLAETQLRIVEAVRLAYYDVYFHQKAIEITKASDNLLRKFFIPLADARYRTGKASQQDVLRAQLELNKTENQVVQLDRQLKVTQADLAKLLALPPESNLQASALPPLPPLPEHFDHLYKSATALRPELQGKLQAILRDERGIDLAKLDYYPDVALGVSWNSITRNDALSRVANGNDTVGFMVGINLPIWHKKLRAGVLEAENRAAASARIYEATRDDTFRLIRRFTIQAKTFEEQIQLYNKRLIPRADQTLKISIEDYRVGKTDALQVIDNWLQLLRLRIQLARLDTALGQSIASLERFVGSELSAAANGSPQAQCEDAPLIGSTEPIPTLPRPLPANIAP